MTDNIDEDALILNVACGTSVPESLAGSIKDDPQQSPNRAAQIVGLLAALIVGAIVWFLLL
jgi:hypothetical protein